jgi:antitoxin component of MazEF toxin-antitoxin module
MECGNDRTEPFKTKTLTRHGNSLALVIDKPILEQMGVDENTPLTLAFDGRCVIVTRAPSSALRKMVRSTIDEIRHEFGNALKKLAE